MDMLQLKFIDIMGFLKTIMDVLYIIDILYYTEINDCWGIGVLNCINIGIYLKPILEKNIYYFSPILYPRDSPNTL